MPLPLGPCDESDISGNPGVDTSFCFVEGNPNPPNGLEAFSWSWSEIDVDDEKKTSVGSNIIGRQLQDAKAPVIPTEIVSVEFLEFNTSGDLTVINQDDTYADVSLGDGDTLTFNSISSLLDTSVPLADQMSSPALVPGGASLSLYGTTETGEIVRNRFFWFYNMECGADTNPVQMGDQIGWVRVVSMHIVFSFVFSIVKMS